MSICVGAGAAAATSAISSLQPETASSSEDNGRAGGEAAGRDEEHDVSRRAAVQKQILDKIIEELVVHSRPEVISHASIIVFTAHFAQQFEGGGSPAISLVSCMYTFCCFLCHCKSTLKLVTHQLSSAAKMGQSCSTW